MECSSITSAQKIIQYNLSLCGLRSALDRVCGRDVGWKNLAGNQVPSTTSGSVLFFANAWLAMKRHISRPGRNESKNKRRRTEEPKPDGEWNCPLFPQAYCPIPEGILWKEDLTIQFRRCGELYPQESQRTRLAFSVLYIYSLEQGHQGLWGLFLPQLQIEASLPWDQCGWTTSWFCLQLGV